MTPERWRQISHLYHAAAQCDPAERGAFLDQVCEDDPALRGELETLLSGERTAEELLGGTLVDAQEPLIGRSLGAYAIESLLGSGGMGHVYLARDSKLGRRVALKVLPALSALDDDRLARFRREAQLLASLNHPNIAQIYGVEESGGTHALVLELVEGPTLAERIARGPLPLPEALAVARQIADALAAAHGCGIVHRDLKPANITVRADGTVKVLDFGLAKALAPEAALSPGRAHSLMTARGVVLGTVAYMAPEQARGKESDNRVDIWAFGVVLYEMLTGRSPFAGESVADTVGAVLHTTPDWTAVPAQVRPLLERCLEKHAVLRLHDIADARLWLETPVLLRRPWWHRLAAAAAVLLVLTTVALAIPYFDTAAPVTPLMQFSVPPPPQSRITGYIVMSPGGRHLMFVAADAGERGMIWVHSLESGESHPLTAAGHVGTSSTIWSHDSRYIAYVANDGTLKKVPIAGGPPETICELSGLSWAGGSWNANDVIVFGQHNGGLMRVSAAGGDPTPLTQLAASRQDIGHGGPRFLPDGRHFVYSRASTTDDNNGVFVGSLDLPPDRQPSDQLLTTRSRPVYAPSTDPDRGHLLLVRDGVLLAYPFDHRRRMLAGDPVPITDGVGGTESGRAFIGAASASTDGLLAYRRVDGASIQVVVNWRALLNPRG